MTPLSTIRRVFQSLLIDFSGFLAGDHDGRNHVAWLIRKATQDWGFFYLKDHGLPGDLTDRAFRQSFEFFNLPLEEKLSLEWRGSASNRGYVGLGRERLNPAAGDDFKEAFNVGPEAVFDETDGVELPLFQNVWPRPLPEFKSCALEMFEYCTLLSNRILESFALALDVPPIFFAGFHNEKQHTLRFLHYPCPVTDPGIHQEGQLAGEHSDYGSISLLFQDDVGGLEIRDPDGRWIPAAPISNTIIVNTGDLMERWTNGVLRSTPHRVSGSILKASKDRYSIAFFCHPNESANIQCIPSCSDGNHPPLYSPVKAGEYLASRLKATY